MNKISLSLTIIITLISSLIFLIYMYKRAKQYKYDYFTDNSTELIEIPHFIPKKKNIGDSFNGVPLVIYETWHSRNIPRGMKENIDNLLQTNPEFDYYLYSDKESIDFIRNNFDSKVGDAYESLIPGAFKADLWRLCILYKKGGAYLDVKLYTLIPLIELISKHSIIYVKDTESLNFIKDNGKCYSSVWNGFIISPPGNELFMRCIEDIVDAYENKLLRDNHLDLTGPCQFGRILDTIHPSYFSNNNLFKFKNVTEPEKGYTPGILYNDKIIIKQYDSYRDELKKNKVTGFYWELWDNKQIWK